MKKMNFYAFAAMVAGAGLLASCSQNEGDSAADDPNAPVEVAFTSNIGEVSETPLNGTRVLDNKWEVTDQIKIAMYKDGNQLAAQDYAAKTAGTTSEFQAATPLYFPADDSNVTFDAVYPASFAETGAKISTADQSNFSALDVLYAATTSAVNKTWARTKVGGSFPKVELAFEHKMSKVTVVVQAEAGITFKQNTVGVTFKNIYPEGKWNAATKAVEVFEETPVADIAANGVSDPTVTTLAKFEAIMIPTTYANEGDFVMEIKHDTNKYYWSNNAALTLEAGCSYVYTVTLRQTGVEVSASIKDWTVGTNTDVDAY